MILAWYTLLVFTQVEFYEPEQILEFADHLFTMEEYRGAAGEYQRYLFLSDTVTDTIHEKVVACYARLEEWDKALTAADALRDNNRKNYTKGWLFFLAGNYDSSRVFLSRAHEPYQDEARRFIGLGLAHEYRFEEAGAFIELPSTLPRYKSPVLGGVCSLIPGGGQLYSGRGGDALYAFIVVTGTSLLAYYYYDREEDLKFGISLGTAILFYAGNIYGGINAARNFNYYQNVKYLSETVELAR